VRTHPAIEKLRVSEVGKYKIEKELGRGATSTVYQAYDPFADRQVAIKLLQLDEMESEDSRHFRQLFLTEASLAGKFAHPHITSIYDAVITDEANYLVMEYVGGGTLERYCRVDNLLPPDKVIEIMFKCCRALNYACQNGIIHRDIKPENILIVDGTNIKISDFGAAIVEKTRLDKKSLITGVGSLAYMSPQQLQDMELTQQADIYSLGVVFYRMLTGSLPFNAPNDSAMMYQILNVEPPAPSTYRMDIPKLLDKLVMKSIAKDLEDRHQNWEEFEQELVLAFDKLPREVSSFPDTEKFNTLRKLNFFKEFGEIELWEVLRISNWAYYPEGTTIIHEGDETASFFIIISGEVEIRKSGRKLCTLNEGECFGEMSGIRKVVRRRSASVVAYRDLKLIEVNERLLEQSSENCQRRFDKAFLEILANRLAAAGAQGNTSERGRRLHQPRTTAAVPNRPPSRVDNSIASSYAKEEKNSAGIKWSLITLIGLIAFIILVYFIYLP
jgi:eukaryotic-like serine/threonine-protein kinase